MSVLTTLADGHYTLTAGAAEHRVKALIDQQVQADFVRWHFERAVADLGAARPLYTDAEFTVERNRLRDDFRKGLYDFKSAKGAELLATLPGIAFLCSRLIEGVDESSALELIATCHEDVSELLKAIIQDSFPETLKLAGQKKTGP